MGALYFNNQGVNQSNNVNGVQNQLPTVPVNVGIVSTTTTTSQEVSTTYPVLIINFSFNPASLTVNKGDTVIWTNNDSAPHQVVGDNLNGLVMNKGQTFSQTFNSSGTFNYHCAIHPMMTGVITVK